MTLKEYIQGERKGKEANRLERQAMTDPFLNDAIEGFDAVGGDHIPVIERLETKALRVRAHSRRILVYWAMAASVLLLIGFGSFYLLQKKQDNRMPDVAAILPKKIMPSVPLLDSLGMESTHATHKALKNKTLAVATAPIAGELHKEEAPALPAPASAKEEKAASVSVTEAVVPQRAQVSSVLQAKAAGIRSVTADIAAPRVVRGKVIDERGEPLIGAVVKVEGAEKGAVADVNGDFSFQVSGNDSAKLVASYIGFEQREFKASSEPVTVALTPSSHALNEVVVVGYGGSTKKLTSGMPAQIAALSFGEQEFRSYCKTEGKQHLCGKSKTKVKVVFVISKEGRPTGIKVTKATCQPAADEVERLLKSSPGWTKKDRKVTLTIRW